MTVTTKRSIIALLLSLVLVVSIFTVGISATDAGTDVSSTETVTEVESSTEKDSSTATGTEKETGKETESQTESSSEKAEREEREATAKTLIINGIIIAAIILIVVIVAVRFRKKLGGFFRSVKSELKKIVWSSKENTRKSFLVVAVVAVAVALLIAIIDFAFTQGISMLGELFK